MASPVRSSILAIGAVFALVILAVLALPLFLNADSFRTRIESTLTNSLGRKVTIGKLDLSIWTGGLMAENTAIADDSTFSSLPFVAAESVKISVKIFPLVFHRQVQIQGFSLISPKVRLLRAANGTWNYSTIGTSAGKPAVQDEATKQTFPNLTVSHVVVENGQFTVETSSGTNGAANSSTRIYEQVNLDVKDFGFTNSFPFTASAHLPSDGIVTLNGTAGPIHSQDASATPFAGHLEMKHIDLVAAGFVDVSSEVTGMVQAMTLDVTWNGQQMHIAKLLIDSPNMTIVRSNTPPTPKQTDTNAEGSTMLKSLSIDNAQIKDGAITLKTAGQTSEASYQQLNAQITNISPKAASPFSLGAHLPGGGSFDAKGIVGPFNSENSSATPLDAQVILKHVEISSAGILPADAGIAGVMDVQTQVKSDGQTLTATGSTQIAGIKLAKNGQPSAKPVELQFAILQNEQAMTGQVQHATFIVGRAAINMTGTYQSSGPTTALDLKINGDSVPIDEIVAFLPALGVRLPQGSQLKGGTLTTALTVSGSSASPIISGPVQLNNTQLAGFDLGSKLQTLSQLTGGRIGSATGSGTNIRSLSMNIRQTGSAIRTDKIALDVTGVGTATGSGDVSESGALNYNMLLKLTGLIGSSSSNTATPSTSGGAAGLIGSLAGMIPGGGSATSSLGSIGGITSAVLKNGIPIAITGTTSNPILAPNMRGLATGVGAGAAQTRS